MRQRLKALKIAALRQNHIVEIREFVKEDINSDDIFIALENLGLLIVVSPPLNRVACVAERHFSRLGVVKVRMSLCNMLEVVVFGHRLQIKHAHRLRRIVGLANLPIIRMRECEHERHILDEAVFFPNSRTEGHLRIVVGPAIACRIKADEAADSIRRTNKIVEREYRPARQEGVLVAGDARKRINAHRTIRKRHAIDGNSLSDMSCFAILFRNLANRRGGNGRNAFRILRRVGLNVLFIQGETSRARLSIDLERAFKRRLLAFVIRLHGIVGKVHVESLVRALGANDSLRFKVDKRGTIGSIRQEVDIDEILFMNKNVRHGQSHRGIGSGQNGNPKISLLARSAHVRIEAHEAQTFLTALREGLDRHVEAMTRRRTGVGSELNNVIAIFVVRHRIA